MRIYEERGCQSNFLKPLTSSLIRNFNLQLAMGSSRFCTASKQRRKSFF